MLDDVDEQCTEVLDPSSAGKPLACGHLENEGRKEGSKGIVPIGGRKRALRDRQLRATTSWMISTNCYDALEGTIVSCNNEALPLRLVVVLSLSLSLSLVNDISRSPTNQSIPVANTAQRALGNCYSGYRRL